MAITFTIYDAASGGTALWMETHPAVSVADGLFNVRLGSITGLNDYFGAPRWIGIAVGSDTEMSPRESFSSVAHAYRVHTVDGASGGHIFGETSVGDEKLPA